MDLRRYQKTENQYAHLSLKDLLDARNQYHVELMNHPHVVATAVGRYRIRRKDSWPNERGMGERHGTYARTLGNSEVRAYSWPAILVFVDEWIEPERFQGTSDVKERGTGASRGGRYDPDDMVPRTLYLPDGRRVPVCVILAPKELEVPPTPEIRYPVNNIGGGYPILVDVQGRLHVATIACLVSDGHTTYALTNRHVTGEEGEEVAAVLDGKMQRVGTSAGRQLTRVAFEELYPGWIGRDVYVNLDVGLVRIDELDRWSARVRGIGVVAPMADLSVNNISLQLIGCAVSGHGAATGRMEGEIHALFYRYKSQGGFEYVADLLIGPRREKEPGEEREVTFTTGPGDSGTLWVLEPLEKPEDARRVQVKREDPKAQPEPDPKEAPPQPLPLALQWGENILAPEGDRKQSYALATFLSRVCTMLEVDLVRDWNLDQPDVWGAIGHFSIATRATVPLSGDFPKLSKLMKENEPIIAPDDATILGNDFTGMGEAKFVPLADVPDFYWKHGKQGHTRGMEGPNHFADMDQPAAGATLLELCKKPEYIDPAKWDAFYDSVNDLLTGDPIEARHRGLLPFRVWQIFDAMVEFAGDKNRTAEFVCAAGVLAHYIGDACQPLHISYLHDGDPERATTKTVHHKNGTTDEVQVALGQGVHGAYEDEMIGAHRADILDGLKQTGNVTAAERVANGFEAAKATIELMRNTFALLPPIEIVDRFVDSAGMKKKERVEDLWDAFGARTIQAMQDGTHLLALLWESAWEQGGGEAKGHKTAKLTKPKAMAVCANRDFIPSVGIADIATHLKAP